MHEILSQTLGQQIAHFVKSALQQRHEYGIKSPMMLLTLTNRLQLLANRSYIRKTLSNKADFKNCQYLDGEIDELIISNVYPSKHGL